MHTFYQLGKNLHFPPFIYPLSIIIIIRPYFRHTPRGGWGAQTEKYTPLSLTQGIQGIQGEFKEFKENSRNSRNSRIKDQGRCYIPAIVSALYPVL